jgi:hypothetical protein
MHTIEADEGSTDARSACDIREAETVLEGTDEQLQNSAD